MADSIDEFSSLRTSMAALEAQRSLLGDAVVDAALGPMREKLAALQAAELAEQQRKQVTILFADIVGFTSMSERMDPEEITSILNRIWQEIDGVIVDHGGHIDKHIGDAVMALWGTEAAREDDPEQAVRAALVMQQKVAALKMMRSDDGQLIGMRIGISTGPVLLGEVGATHEFTAIGDPVNVASRLQHFCPPGRVLIAHDTYRHVRGVFDMRPLEPVSLKGKAEPMRVYLVEQAKRRVFRQITRGIEGLETRMIGRDSKLKNLQDAISVTNQDRVLTVITIVGEPGIGKSRLIYEFENWADLQPVNLLLFRGRGREETTHVPYSIWRDLFALQFDIHDNDSLSQVRDKMSAGISEWTLTAPEKTERQVEVLGQLLGYDFAGDGPRSRAELDARQLQEQGVVYLGNYFKAASANNPAILLIEDLHWGDDSSLDVLIKLCQIMRQTALLIISTARLTLYEKRPNWFEGRSFHTRIDLKPLSRSDSRLLIDEILRKVDHLPDAFRELIASSSEGNPFYAEELVKMMVEQDVISSGSGDWKVYPERLNSIFIPPTLTGVLQARLDSLTAVERTIIQQAAVIGRIFWDEALFNFNEGAIEQLSKEAIVTALSSLRNRELIYLHDLSIVEGAKEYIFKHALLRDVTYESVLISRRRQYHSQAASWLIGHGSEKAAKVSGLAAEHFERSGEKEEASRYFILAGENAVKNFANREAADYFSHALKLIAQDDVEIRWKLLLARVDLNLILGDASETASDLQALEELTRHEDNNEWWTILYVRQSSHYEVIGDFTAGIAAANKAIEMARKGNMPDQLAEAQIILGRIYWRRGDFHESVEHQRQALDILRKLDDHKKLAIALVEYGGAVWTDGDAQGGTEYTALGLKKAQETGNRVVEANALNNLGYSAWAYGDYSQAEKYLDAAIIVLRETGSRRDFSDSTVMMGRIALAKKSYPQALQLFKEAVRINEETEYLANIGIGLGGVADAYAGLGQLGEAEEYYRQSIEASEEYDRTERAMRIRANWARMALEQGKTDQARRLVDEILQFVDQGNRLYGSIEPLAALAVCIRVLQVTDDPRAESLLDETYSNLMSLAEQIPDVEGRRLFLENVPWHQEIIAMWENLHGIK